LISGGERGGLRKIVAVFGRGRGGDRPLHDMPPVGGFLDPIEIGPDRGPGGGVHAGGQAIGHGGMIEQVDRTTVERLQLIGIEARGRAAEAGEIETGDQRRRIGDGLDRVAGADTSEQRLEGDRLDPIGAEGVAAERAEALR
jgi:hypothetical protein